MSTEAIENGQEGTSNITPEIRNKALAGGWSDKEHWKGAPDAWVDADVFVKRGDEWLGNVRKQNEALSRDLQSTKDQLKELRSATEDFKKFQKEAYERKVRELETNMAFIKAERAKAISDGDGEKVNELDDKLDLAKEEVKEAKAASVEELKPVETTSPIASELQSWLDQNSWFGQDKRLTGIANGIGESLRLEFPLLKGQAFLDKLDEVLEEEMPTKFGKKTRSGPAVESGSGRGGRGSGNAKSYDNLPSEAKSACDRFVKQKLMTREQYVSEYSWE